MWKARLCFLRFPRKRKIPGFVFGDFPVPSFPRPLRGWPQGREEPAFRLLHAPGGFGVAAGSRDALQHGRGESGAQVLRRVGQGQQGLQRGLIAAIEAAAAAFLVERDVGLGARTMVVEIGIEVGGVELLQAPGVPGREYSRSPCVCG